MAARVVGITLSSSQAELELARERVVVRRRDSSGSFVEIGACRTIESSAARLLTRSPRSECSSTSARSAWTSIPEALFTSYAKRCCLLSESMAISTPGGSKMHGRTFINRYVFPDGELVDVADVLAAMERADFEVRDVESLREHYVTTLHAWVTNLENSWGEAVGLVGDARARIWRLYMAASANGFKVGGLALHQVLGVRAAEQGASGMPTTRARWG